MWNAWYVTCNDYTNMTHKHNAVEIQWPIDYNSMYNKNIPIIMDDT